MTETPRIGFCTSCRGRRWQLEQTLDTTLDTLRGSRHFLALFNDASSDGLDDHVRQHHADAIADGRLIHFHTLEARPWHVSRAKNTAHRLAIAHQADWLFNLDADNFLSKQDLDWVTAIIADGMDTLLHQWSLAFDDGSFGRIGLATDAWTRLGGYDESFLPMGWQDLDLLMRARMLGLAYRRAAPELTAIANSLEDKLAELDDVPDGPDAATRYRTLNRENIARSFARPALLNWADQQRVKGELNFERECLV